MRLSTVFREAVSGLRRNVAMVVSIILVTFLSLTFVGTASLLQLQIGEMKNYWYDRAQVAVYLCSSISPADACPQGEASDDIKAAVEAKLSEETLKPFVDKYYFEDHEQAYKHFQEQFEGNAVAQYVTKEQLNETYWIKLNDPEKSQIVTETFTGVAGVEEVRDQRSYLDQIFSILNAASLAAVGVAVLMLFSSALLISTTIRLSAFSPRRDIGILRLVGAIVQFFVQGVLAPRLPFTNLVGLTDGLTVFPVLVGLGVLLAAIASGTAIRRYLRI